MSNWLIILLAIFVAGVFLLGGIVFLIFAATVLVQEILTGLPYVSTKKEKLSSILELAHITPGQKAVDLGSGDGRIVIALARAGAQAYGFEINPFLRLISKIKIKLAGVQNRASILKQDFWNANLSQFDTAVIYGIKSIMEKLEKKLINELKPGAKIITVGAKFPNLSPKNQRKDIYLYQI